MRDTSCEPVEPPAKNNVKLAPTGVLGRFTKSERPKFQAIALTREECDRFLNAAKEICLEYCVLFLTALRAELRRGELVALVWGDIQFGASEENPNRFIFMEHNYVNRQFTTPKSKKSRRVDLSRQLRRALLELRDERLLKAFQDGKTSIADDLVFPSPKVRFWTRTIWSSGTSCLA